MHDFVTKKNLNFEIISAGHEQRLLIVEAHATHGTIVLVELLQQCAHPVIPQLDHAIVQTNKKNTQI